MLQRQSFLAILVLAGLALTAYHGALDNALLAWDDTTFITNNTYIHALTPENLVWMLRELERDHWHPLTWLSYAAAYAPGADGAWRQHAWNIGLHGLNSIAVFYLALLLFNHTANAGRLFVPPQKAGVYLGAWLAALLFAVHPQHVESVAWATERKDLLCQFFFIAALIAYLGYARSVTPSARRYWYALTFINTVLALAAKSMAVSLPLVFLLLDGYPLARMHRDNFWRLLREKLPFFLLSLLTAALIVWGQQAIGTVSGLEDFRLGSRFLNAANSAMLYISKFLLPVGLSPHYPFPAYDNLLENWPRYLPALIGVASMFAVGAYLWHKGRRYWLAAWLFYLVTLAPVAGILQVGGQAAADRYAYLPTLPFYLLAGAGLAQLYLRLRGLRRAMLGAAVMVLVLVLLQQTRALTEVWRDDISLWQRALSLAPEDHLANTNLAAQYFIRGDYGKAIYHYRISMQASMKPGDYYYLALSYLNNGQLQEARGTYEAMLAFNLPLGDKLADVHANLSAIYLTQELPQQARASAQQALALNPGQTTALRVLAELE